MMDMERLTNDGKMRARRRMKIFIQHTRIYVFRGLLAIIPVFLSVAAIRLFYELIDKRVIAFLDHFFQIRHIPGLGILLVLVCLYMIGMIVSNVAGRSFFNFIEFISQRIPIVGAIYQVGKQVSDGLASAGNKQAFKKVILIDWNNNGIWAVGFVAGYIKDQRNGETLVRVFMPHSPSPATGFIFLAKESHIVDPGWSVEEAIKMIISGAIISPQEIQQK